MPPCDIFTGIPPQRLRECLNKIFPAVMPELLLEAANPEPDFDNIARIISLDPALATAILGLVNSPYYGLSQRVTDLKRAAVVIGKREIFKLAFSVTLIKNMNDTLGDRKTDFFANWRLVIWSAIASELIAEHSDPGHAAIAYLCALIKDISLLIAVSIDPEVLDQHPLPLCHNGKDPHVQDHARTTQELLEQWNFPPEFFPPINHHHDMDRIESLAPLDQAVTLGTRWAEIEMDPSGHPADLVQFKLTLQRLLNLGDEEVNALREQCVNRFRSMTASLNIFEAPEDCRLYAHSLRTIQYYYFQSMDLTRVEGGLPAVAGTVLRHLSWNWDIRDCDLALRQPDSGGWTLFALSGQEMTQSREAASPAALPWRTGRKGFLLKASGRVLGELRPVETPRGEDAAGLQLYLWFASQSYEHYFLRQAVMESRSQALELLPVGVASLDDAGRVLDCNQRLKSFLGTTKDVRKGSFWKMLSRSKGIDCDRDWERFLKQPGSNCFSRIVCPLGPEGTRQQVCLYIAAYTSSVGQSKRVLVMVEDVSEVTDLQFQALRQRDFLSRLMHAMQEVVLVVNGGGTIEFASPRLADELEGKNLFLAAQPTELFTAHWDPSLLREKQAPFEIHLSLTGRTHPLPLEIVVSQLNEHPPSFLIVGRDLSAIHRLENKIKRQAIYDHLTGIFNRHQFQIFLEREAARSRRRKEPLGLIFMDIDRFKDLNDLEGHQAGDRALQLIGSVLRSTIRKGMDYPCRFGGDEFTILTTNTNGRELEKLAERLSAACQEKLPGKLSLSIGLALLKEDEETEDFLKRADAACLEAKTSGGNRLKWP